MRLIPIVAAVAATVTLGASAHAASNYVTNPDFVGTGGQGGYGEFYPDPNVSTNNKPAYSVQIAGWDAVQSSSVNSNAPFLFSVDPTTIDTTGFYDSWDKSTPKLWGSDIAGGHGKVVAPPNGATSALLLDADYHITPIYQALTGLIPNNEYTISFDWANDQWAQNSGATTEGLEIGLGGTVIQIAGINSKGVNGFSLPSQTFGGWHTFTASFYYTGNPTTMTYGLDYGGETFTAAANWLTFIGEGSPQGEPPTLLLTGVSLTDASNVPPYVNPALPEPATWAMMILGVAGIGAIARRRRANFAVAI